MVSALADLVREAAHCTRCPLFEHATQTVFGEGSAHAPLVFVGEQPGDQEDLAGRPFVGPAGRLFDQALDAAGIDRSKAYVTNAVKHFKFVRRGKRRMHDKPNVAEIEQCRWWLDQELRLIRPAVTVALGATAARALCGRAVVISRARGLVLEDMEGRPLRVTIHPSALLRLRDQAQRHREFDRFVADLVDIAALVPSVRRRTA